MTSTVRIPWEWNGPNKEMWNHVSARVIERFGLPGDRYTCLIGVQHMDYIFESNKDALMFALEHNGEIIPDSQLTVECVVKFMT